MADGLVRATERAGTPLGSFVETFTETFVPAGALLFGNVMVSVKPPTLGNATGAPTSDAGMAVAADCGTALGWLVGMIFGVVDPELQP
jgi:hypothetical protein